MGGLCRQDTDSGFSVRGAYRCPEHFATVLLDGQLSEDSGTFISGPKPFVTVSRPPVVARPAQV